MEPKSIPKRDRSLRAKRFCLLEATWAVLEAARAVFGTFRERLGAVLCLNPPHNLQKPGQDDPKGHGHEKSFTGVALELFGAAF